MVNYRDSKTETHLFPTHWSWSEKVKRCFGSRETSVNLPTKSEGRYNFLVITKVIVNF